MRGLFDSRKNFLFQGGRVHMRDLPKHDVKGGGGGGWGLSLKKINCMFVFSISQFSKIACYMILIVLSDVFIII